MTDLERRLIEAAAARDEAIAHAAEIEAAWHEQRADLADRLDRACESLAAIAALSHGNAEHKARLAGKAQGVELAAGYLYDWIRLTEDNEVA